MPESPMPPIIGPFGDRNKRTIRVGFVHPRQDLGLAKTQNVRGESVAAGKLAAAVPSKHRLSGEPQETGDLARREKALAHGDATSGRMAEPATQSRPQGEER